MINETNYHVYLDDFVNGLLDEELELEFVAFLDKHPNILEGESLDSFEAELPHAFKSGLKKEIPFKERSPDELLVASMEGDLTEQEEAELAEQIAATPSLQKDKAIFALTRLEADLSIKYPYKKNLRKRPVVLLYTRWASAIAAVFILGMLLFRFLGADQSSDSRQARITPQTQSPSEIQTRVPGEIADSREEIAIQVAEGRKPTYKQPSDPQKNRKQENPSSLPNQTFAIEAPDLHDELVLVRLEENPDMETNRQVLASGDQSVWQWAYKKVRGKVGEAEIIVPEKEIPRDAANLVLAKVAPVIQYNQDGNGSSFRIGGLEINRRTTH
ncbi:MAG TPA: hypothetical protein DIW47_15695 [Bacteroidetes bacterium]|nr:hypothetical protein [Bacteroidota bacterium]